MALISTRIPEEIEQALKWYAKKEQIGKTIALRKALDTGLKELKLQYALDLYQKRKITVSKAAKIAGMSLWEILDIITEKKISSNYTISDVEADLKIVKKLR